MTVISEKSILDSKSEKMSIQEAKVEIIGLLDEMPEVSVINVLEYLREMKILVGLDEETAINLSLIMKEDNQLLKQLAK